MRTPDDTDLLDIKLLRLFDFLYRTGSVTRCADLLGQSQPTVSIWLARLRQELNDPLFVRTPLGMQPTPRADALIPIAREALESLRRLSAEKTIFTPSSAQRSFCICMTDASHANLLPQLLTHVRAAAPGISLETERIDSSTAGRLQSGEADLAVGLIQELGAGFYQQTLFTQDWVCLANAAHPRLAGDLTRQAYEAERHVGIISGTGQSLLAAAIEEQQIERRLAVKIFGFLGLSAILSSTDLIATLPRQTAETLAKNNPLRVYGCPFPIPSFSVKQHWHARYHHDLANQWLRGVFARLFLHR